MVLKQRKKQQLPRIDTNRNYREITREISAIRTRQPIITYMHSPTPIHTDEQNFRWVVQRMTGSRATQKRCEEKHQARGQKLSQVLVSECSSTIGTYSLLHPTAITFEAENQQTCLHQTSDSPATYCDPTALSLSQFSHNVNLFESTTEANRTHIAAPGMEKSTSSPSYHHLHFLSEASYPSEDDSMLKEDNAAPVLSPRSEQRESSPVLLHWSEWRCNKTYTDGIESPGSLAYQDMAFQLLLSQQIE